MKRNLTAAGLAVVLTFSLSITTLAAQPLFPKIVEMPTFTDLAPVPPPGSPWYDYQSVKTTVEAGFMKGTGDGAFLPGGDITLAEVAAIAARVNEKTTGYAIPAPEKGQTWYAPYLAVMTHIGVDVGSNPTAKATRSDFVRILSAVLPDSMMAAINTVTSLPDTKDPDVLRFYNAGILTGKDAYGTFYGDKTLFRSEVTAMLARIINPDLRKSFTPAYSPETTPSPSPAPSVTPPPPESITAPEPPPAPSETPA